jgi:hypothetical protein
MSYSPLGRPGHSLNRALELRSFSLFFLFALKNLPLFPHPFTCKKGKQERNSSAIWARDWASAQVCLSVTKLWDVVNFILQIRCCHHKIQVNRVVNVELLRPRTAFMFRVKRLTCKNKIELLYRLVYIFKSRDLFVFVFVKYSAALSTNNWKISLAHCRVCSTVLG